MDNLSQSSAADEVLRCTRLNALSTPNLANVNVIVNFTIVAL